MPSSRAGSRLSAIRVVNGYPCRNCADEARAKRGIDPAHASGPAAGLREGQSAADNARERPEKAAALGVNQPDPSGSVGTRLNLLA